MEGLPTEEKTIAVGERGMPGRGSWNARFHSGPWVDGARCERTDEQARALALVWPPGDGRNRSTQPTKSLSRASAVFPLHTLPLHTQPRLLRSPGAWLDARSPHLAAFTRSSASDLPTAVDDQKRTERKGTQDQRVLPRGLVRGNREMTHQFPYANQRIRSLQGQHMHPQYNFGAACDAWWSRSS